MSNVIGIGARPLRKEDRRFLTGRGNYVADIKRPDMVAGVFIRSPHAHASIKSIEIPAYPQGSAKNKVGTLTRSMLGMMSRPMVLVRNTG